MVGVAVFEPQNVEQGMSNYEVSTTSFLKFNAIFRDSTA